jgi:hypothetical protein
MCVCVCVCVCMNERYTWKCLLKLVTLTAQTNSGQFMFSVSGRFLQVISSQYLGAPFVQVNSLIHKILDEEGGDP